MLEGRNSPFFDTTLVAVVTSIDSSSYTDSSGADWPGHTLTPWRNLRSLRHEVVRSISHLIPWGLIDRRPGYWLADSGTEVPIDPVFIATLFEREAFQISRDSATYFFNIHRILTLLAHAEIIRDRNHADPYPLRLERLVTGTIGDRFYFNGWSTQHISEFNATGRQVHRAAAVAERRASIIRPQLQRIIRRCIAHRLSFEGEPGGTLPPPLDERFDWGLQPGESLYPRQSVYSSAGAHLQSQSGLTGPLSLATEFPYHLFPLLISHLVQAGTHFERNPIIRESKADPISSRVLAWHVRFLHRVDYCLTRNPRWRTSPNPDRAGPGVHHRTSIGTGPCPGLSTDPSSALPGPARQQKRILREIHAGPRLHIGIAAQQYITAKFRGPAGRILTFYRELLRLQYHG